MAENTNLGLTADAWANIVIERWEQKIVALNIGDTRTLLNSFVHQVFTDSNGNVELIRFALEYYGKMVDMGVGRGVTADQVGITKTNRKPKPWYSKTFAGQIKKLAEILAEKYAKKATVVIVENIQDNALKWQKSWKKVE